MMHFYRNVWTMVPKGKVRDVAAMLKAVHAQGDRPAAEAKAAQEVVLLGRGREAGSLFEAGWCRGVFGTAKCHRKCHQNCHQQNFPRSHRLGEGA